MNRLIEEKSLGRSDQHLADLFRAGTRPEADPFRKRRVLVSLMRAHTHGTRRRRLPAVLATTLLISGSAAAAFGHRYAARNGLFGLGASTHAAEAGALAPRIALADPSAPKQIETDEASEPVAAADSAPAPRPAATGTHADVNAHTRRSSGDDVTRVVEAIQALRMDSDPSRAQALLDDYLKAHPHGVLSADALALSIEAASAQHDPRAADYARRYLARFPQGKYRELANRALAKY